MKATLKRRIYLARSVLGIEDGPIEEADGIRFRVHYVQLRFRARHRGWVFELATVKGNVVGADGRPTRQEASTQYLATEAPEWLTALAADPAHGPTLG